MPTSSGVLATTTEHAETWTDRIGVVHEENPQNPNDTRCGIRIEGASCRTARRGCGTCIRLNLAEWAANHRYTPGCRGWVCV